MNTETPPPLLTQQQAAKRLAVGVRMIERLIASGQLPAVRVGRYVRIDPADLAAFLERGRTLPAPAACVGAVELREVGNG
jgi:excisionase family DNA binding protein